METLTQIMYAVFDGSRIIALFNDRDDAVVVATADQTVERVRASITRITK